MKKITRVAAAAGMIAAVATLGVAISEDRKGVVHVDSATASYTELSPGASGATVWGDEKNGPHAAFTKFAAGSQFALHTHTNDLRIVVLKGAYVYKPQDGEEIRVSAGQYLLIPGGARHATGSDAKNGALFYQEADAKFDINFVE